MSSSIKVSVSFLSALSLDRAAMHADLETAMNAYENENKSDFSFIEGVMNNYLGRNPDMTTISAAQLVSRAHEAKSAELRANGGDDAAVDAALTSLKVSVPAFLKSRPNQFFVAKGKGGTSVRFLTTEPGVRISDEAWAKLTAPKPVSE